MNSTLHLKTQKDVINAKNHQRNIPSSSNFSDRLALKVRGVRKNRLTEPNRTAVNNRGFTVQFGYG